MDLEFLLDLGYVGLFIGTFIAATVVPFSSDFLIVGILIAGGDPLISWICATAGNWLGGLTSYWIGRIGKWEWIEKWFRVKEETLLKQKSKIDKYGSSTSAAAPSSCSSARAPASPSGSHSTTFSATLCLC